MSNLLDLLPREITHICPDAVHLPVFLSPQQQLDLLLICRTAAAQTGMVCPVVGGSGDKQLRMQVKVTSLGYYWTPTEGYKAPILAMPKVLVQIANAAVAKAIPRLALGDSALFRFSNEVTEKKIRDGLSRHHQNHSRNCTNGHEARSFEHHHSPSEGVPLWIDRLN